MSDFQRYAIYYLPEDPALAAFGAAWLGWDVETGKAVPQLPVEGLAEITATPRKYGFHGTLKPPFRLADGGTRASLEAALGDFAARTPAVTVDALTPAQIGRFLALTPDGDTRALNALAFACVTEFDRFRRTADAGELARRRAAGLTDRQETLLTTWGYPYVGPEFRFHLTLSEKLDPETVRRARDALDLHLPPLPRPFPIRTISLAGARADGCFQHIHRYALTG